MAEDVRGGPADRPLGRPVLVAELQGPEAVEPGESARSTIDTLGLPPQPSSARGRASWPVPGADGGHARPGRTGTRTGRRAGRAGCGRRTRARCLRPAGSGDSGSTGGSRWPRGPCGRAPRPALGPWRSQSSTADRHGPALQGGAPRARGPRRRAATAVREAELDGRCVPWGAHYSLGLTVRSVVQPRAADQRRTHRRSRAPFMAAPGAADPNEARGHVARVPVRRPMQTQWRCANSPCVRGDGLVYRSPLRRKAGQGGRIAGPRGGAMRVGFRGGVVCAAMALSACGAGVEQGNTAGDDLLPTGRGAITLQQVGQAAQARKRPGTNGITYHGGPVMTAGPNVYYIWYGNWSATRDQSILTTLAQNIGGSPYFNINTTYTNGSGVNVAEPVTYSGARNDNYSQGTSLSDADIQAIVARSPRQAADRHQRRLLRAHLGGRERDLRLLHPVLRLAHPRRPSAGATSSTPSSATRPAAPRRAPTQTAAPERQRRRRRHGVDHRARARGGDDRPRPQRLVRQPGRRERRQVRLDLRHDLQQRERRAPPT